MSDPNRRGLATEHGKQLFLNPDEMGFSSEEGGNQLKLEDDRFLKMESSKKISIEAVQAVKLKGKQVRMETPAEMKVSKK